MTTPAPWQPGWQPTGQPTGQPSLPTPTPTSSPVQAPPPVPVKVGKKAVGPSGWIGIGGLVLDSLLFGLQENLNLIPAPWGTILVFVIGGLSALGIYRAPNHVLNPSYLPPPPATSSPIPPPTVVNAPRPATPPTTVISTPRPTPPADPRPAAPVSPPPKTSSSRPPTLAETLQADIDAAKRKADTVSDDIKKTLGE